MSREALNCEHFQWWVWWPIVKIKTLQREIERFRSLWGGLHKNLVGVNFIGKASFRIFTLFSNVRVFILFIIIVSELSYFVSKLSYI